MVSQMVDRIGRKRCFFWGTLINGIVPGLHVFFQGGLDGFYLPLIIVRVVHGVGIALCLTAVVTYVADIVPKERLNEGMGMFGNHPLGLPRQWPRVFGVDNRCCQLATDVSRSIGRQWPWHTLISARNGSLDQ